MNHWKSQCGVFLSAQTISLFGSGIVQFAIIWQITLQSKSGGMMSLATICGYVPQLLISLFAGVWADRFQKKYLILISDGLIALVTLCTALCYFANYREVWMLCVVLAIRSAGTGVQIPAVNALLPQLTGKDHVSQVNSMYSIINSSMMFLSPVISGMIVSVLSLEATFLMDVITFLIAAMMLSYIPIQKISLTQDEEGMRVMMKQGGQYIRRHKEIGQLLIFVFCMMVLISPAAFLTPLYIARRFQGEILRLSVSEMTFSLGAVSGGIYMAIKGKKENRVGLLLRATCCYGVGMLAIGAAPSFLLYLLANYFVGICMPCFQTPFQTYLQEQVEPKFHGRVFSIVSIINACALPFGTIVFGPLADRLSLSWIFIGCGASVILCVLAYLSIHRHGQTETE